jgi:hypothetical protein
MARLIVLKLRRLTGPMQEMAMDTIYYAQHAAFMPQRSAARRHPTRADLIVRVQSLESELQRLQAMVAAIEARAAGKPARKRAG